MNSLDISYAKKMNTLGDKMLYITKQFPDIKGCTTIEELKEKYNIYFKRIGDFKKFKLEFMLKLYPGTYPIIIKKEHEELVEELQKFIDGTDLMSNSVDISNCFLDKDNLIRGVIFHEDMLIKGNSLQQNAVKRFTELVEQICIKLGI